MLPISKKNFKLARHHSGGGGMGGGGTNVAKRLIFRPILSQNFNHTQRNFGKKKLQQKRLCHEMNIV
jgi:hypothetical protein